MKRLGTLLAFLLMFGLVTEVFAGDVWVKPYYRKDGTSVGGHYRSRPDGNIFNNYSTQGNVNPYTGKKGYVNSFGNLDSGNSNSSKSKSRSYYGW